MKPIDHIRQQMAINEKIKDEAEDAYHAIVMKKIKAKKASRKNKKVAETKKAG